MERVRFGIIGCGLMGKEFASAAARWCHLSARIAKPEIVAICDQNEEAMAWFEEHVDTIVFKTKDYKELLARDDVDAVYCALPHNLHGVVYSDIINAGKHLLGEKPFGIDKTDNEKILDALKAHPEVVVRCASEFPYYPACQELIRWIKEGRFGKIMEVHTGINHSSDMDLDKPINWKRMIKINGEYGCMGDLGIHTQHVPFRMGWKPKRVYASLSNIATERYDRTGKKVPCETWDNATLTCEMKADNGDEFPVYFEMKRMKPGATNEWYIQVDGLKCSAKFSTTDPNAFYYTESWGKEQGWCRVGVGYKSMIPTITASIFEFGFTDAILQMWAAFMMEIEGKTPEFGCFTPQESALSHKLLTAALRSHKEKCAVEIEA
ncbi:MAG: Gfo/Idh/MocA family oxidoreductase [Roseburia sp.]|nr:Gfo/Idh/MocA family oxidoreductase [Roseburia sp.]